MNTIQQLVENGIDETTAMSMIAGYQRRIGTRNGIYIIRDITYDFDIRGKDIELECIECGNVLHRIMINGRNKWSELIKKCPCQNEKSKKAEFEKNLKKQKDLIISRIGKTYGDYTIVAVDDIDINPKYTLKCNECGNEEIISAKASIFERRKDFHCSKHFAQKIKFDERYVGRKNNRLTILGIYKINGRKYFLCQCDCGNEKYIEPNFWEEGTIKSCGCLKKELELPHSETLDRLRRIHGGMKQRCYNKNCDAYRNYGGRGIIVCDEWHDRDNFIEWALSHGYSNDLSIDRIDVNGIYEPSNCRWADIDTQQANRRPITEWKEPKARERKTWTVNGITMEREKWCEMYGIGLPAVLYRINHMGMSVERALKTPKIQNGRPRKEHI